MPKISVVVVDDSALVRSMLTEIINRQPDMECIGAASDPFVAREMIRNLNPDVITLDVEMPRMDGLDFLSKLMRLRPMPVVMVSTLTERGAEVTISVRPRCTRATVSVIRRADTGSMAAVGSSIARMAGSLTSARARHRRCRWPPDSVAPRSPSSVS